MALKTLSPFPYYGGKARMAPLICDMLDYRNTDIYIEPFGGAARVLLNKPRHDVEIYNDSSAGLCAFMRIMSNNDTANELIGRLYEIEYSPEEFYRALQIRNETEDNFIDELKRQAFLYTKQLIIKYKSDDLELLKENIQRKKIEGITKSFDIIINNEILEDEELAVLNGFKKLFNEFMDIYKGIVLRAYKEQYRINFKSFKDRAIEAVGEKISDYSDEIKSLSSNNENDSTALINKVNKLQKMLSSLYDMKLTDIDKNIKKRLRKQSYKQACEIAYFQASNNHDNVDIDDMDLAVATYVVYSQSRDGMGKDWSSAKYKSTDDYHSQISKLYEVAERLEGVQVSQVGALSYVLECSYLNNERAMLYLDPSYLKPEDEKKNLGTVYKDSFTYEDHEVFLKAIYNAKSKILISNYDTELYNQYLNEDNGWSRIEFETTTSVGDGAGERTEILWYNY